MTCPACGEPISGGRQRCSSCGAVVQPPMEGALAPAPAPASMKTEPLRQIPALQKKERPTWKDEVRERVRHRRRRRHPEAEEGLPLFEQRDGSVAPPASTDAHQEDRVSAESLRDDDLPLQRHSADIEPEAREPLNGAEARAGFTLDEPAFDHESGLAEPEEWSFGAGPARIGDDRAVERPAFLGERAQAAALDAAFLGVLASLVVYFASRRAGVSLAGLRPVWPYLLGYVAFLGLFYATYFTGATGQTLGKLATGLRVADRRGAPPTYSRALLRAALGAMGIALGFAGLVPMLFDPARRAFHDRVFKTRVIRG
jgi:uncharacterized RDD family membrane protein YckC